VLWIRARKLEPFSFSVRIKMIFTAVISFFLSKLFPTALSPGAELVVRSYTLPSVGREMLLPLIVDLVGVKKTFFQSLVFYTNKSSALPTKKGKYGDILDFLSNHHYLKRYW
jgi:hypothetical protein